ncbi:MAG TPA: cytochrome c oxidase subunit II [Actinomycetes bacterium]|nr:cytochrome c oxidase subunit II [Actinomycetes bacterium]
MTRIAGVSKRRLATAGVLVLTALLATGCSIDDLPHQISIPDPATEEGKRIFDLWQATWVALWVVGFITWALILGAAIIFRRRRVGEIPRQTRYNIPIEVMYTVTPLIIIAVFTLFTWRDEAEITNISDNQEVTVNVVGYQWNWTFNYLPGGAVEHGVWQTGTPDQLPTLYLPQGQKVRFVLTSPDVIHSFWIPSFLMKMDVVPGRANQFEVTPTTIGTFAGKCAELCGTQHSQMLFVVKVVSPEDFQLELDHLAAVGQTGSLTTGRAGTAAKDLGNTRIGGQS